MMLRWNVQLYAKEPYMSEVEEECVFYLNANYFHMAADVSTSPDSFRGPAHTNNHFDA